MKPFEIIALNTNEQAQAVFEQGRQAMESGDRTQAQMLFEATLSIYPRHFDALHFLGILHAQAGLSQQALSYFKQAVQLNPSMAGVHNNLALVLDDLQRFDEAIASFDHALSLAPDYEQAKVSRQKTLSRKAATSTIKIK